MIIGVGLTFSGVVLLFLPEGYWIKNAVGFAGENTQRQSIALVIFGVLVLLAGLGFRKR